MSSMTYFQLGLRHFMPSLESHCLADRDTARFNCFNEDFPRHRILRGDCNICCRLLCFGKKFAKLGLSELASISPCG